MMIALKKFFRSVSGFVRERSGNVAITFAFASIPIIAFVGVAVDYSRANSMKAAMQTALDATALMLSKEASTDTQDQLRANAQKYFTALLNKPQAQNINVSVVYGTDGGSNIQITATGSLAAELIPTGWAHTLGLSGDFNLAARSTVRWGINRLRVALVLDNTGSMTDYNKIGALKTATAGLLTQLQGAVTTAGDVYVSIIPFVKDVNFGAPGVGWTEPDYIYWGTAAQDPGLTDNASWDAINGSCNNTNGSTYSTRSACVARGVCSGGTHSSLSGCTSHGNCSFGGADISQTTCASSGTCSLTQYTSQSNCTSHGTCSNSSYTSSSSCTSAGSCTISSKTTQ